MAYFSGPCEIRRAGVDPNGLAQLDLKARDGTFDWHWFLSADERGGKEMLAVALAAIVAGKDVDASMELPDPPADPAWSRVVRFLLID